MIRPYKPADNPHLLRIFALNTPKYFDITEVKDFEAYLAQKAATYLTVEVDHIIVGGTRLLYPKKGQFWPNYLDIF